MCRCHVGIVLCSDTGAAIVRMSGQMAKAEHCAPTSPPQQQVLGCVGLIPAWARAVMNCIIDVVTLHSHAQMR